MFNDSKAGSWAAPAGKQSFLSALGGSGNPQPPAASCAPWQRALPAAPCAWIHSADQMESRHLFIPTVDSARNWHSEAKSIWKQPRNKGYCYGNPWAVLPGKSLQTPRVNICVHKHSGLPKILPPIPWDFICKAQSKPALMAQLLDKGNRLCAENLLCGLTL